MQQVKYLAWVAAVAKVRSLTWEFPYATGTAKKINKRRTRGQKTLLKGKENKQTNKKKQKRSSLHGSVVNESG